MKGEKRMANEDKADKLVYVLNSRPTIFIDEITKEGFPIIVGDGKIDDDALAKCWAFWSGRTVVTDEFLDKTPNLKLIVKQGVGVERIDIDACTRHGVIVANTPKSNYIPVSEHTMALLLASAKKFVPLFFKYKAHDPAYASASNPDACEICGKTLAVIGLGRIGLRVAGFAHAFEMNVVGYDKFRKQEDLPDYIKLEDSLDEAIKQADFITIHVSGIEENRSMIGAKEIALMKPTAVLINTSRGFIIDEDALYEALKDHRIGGAALDVVYDDPVSPDNRLLALDNTIVTPHCAANTPEARDRASYECVKIVTDFAEGIRPDSAQN